MSRATYEGYRGGKKWIVENPRFGRVRVAAPDEPTAMVAAARLWRTKWTAIDFYTSCVVSRA